MFSRKQLHYGKASSPELGLKSVNSTYFGLFGAPGFVIV